MKIMKRSYKFLRLQTCFNLIFGGFLTFGATVYRRRLRLYGSTSSGDRCDGFTHTGGHHWRPRTSSVTRPRRYTHTLGRAYALLQPY